MKICFVKKPESLYYFQQILRVFKCPHKNKHLIFGIISPELHLLLFLLELCVRRLFSFLHGYRLFSLLHGYGVQMCELSDVEVDEEQDEVCTGIHRHQHCKQVRQLGRGFSKHRESRQTDHPKQGEVKLSNRKTSFINGDTLISGVYNLKYVV